MGGHGRALTSRPRPTVIRRTTPKGGSPDDWLCILDDGNVRLDFKKPWSDGTLLAGSYRWRRRCKRGKFWRGWGAWVTRGCNPGASRRQRANWEPVAVFSCQFEAWTRDCWRVVRARASRFAKLARPVTLIPCRESQLVVDPAAGWPGEPEWVEGQGCSLVPSGRNAACRWSLGRCLPCGSRTPGKHRARLAETSWLWRQRHAYRRFPLARSTPAGSRRRLRFSR